MANDQAVDSLSVRDAGDRARILGIAPTFEDAQRDGEASFRGGDGDTDAPFPYV